MADTNIIKLGNNDLNFKVGSSDCKIYLGEVLLYPQSPTPPSFDVKYKFTLTDDSVVSGECDALSAITDAQTEIYKTTLKEAVIGDCVTSISNRAFSSCSGLTSVTIPDSVTNIGAYAFQNCTSLSSVTIPDSVTSIENNAFKGCTKLTSITIPDGVTSIGNGAFKSCTSLTSVTIGDNVTSIGKSAFYECSSLTSVTIEATTPPTLGSGVFSDTNNCPIYVPAASVNAYKAASGWSTYASRIQAIS